MPYILYKTDGTKLVTVDDATLDLSTDLSFVGRNYSGYGQVVNENFLKLLENFSSPTAPSNPLKGQLWYDNGTNSLRVSQDGKTFKGLANIFVQTATPEFQNLNKGDFWWDTSVLQLKAFDGSSFQVIGPLSPAATKAFWIPGDEAGPTASIIPILKASLANDIVSVVSNESFIPVEGSVIGNVYTNVKSGITLRGADPVTGSTTSTGYYFWGTAAESLSAITATNALLATTATTAINVKIPYSFIVPTTVYPTFVGDIAGDQEINAITQFSYNTVDNVLNVTAAAARYADLAERYAADDIYDEGTVLVVGGDKEVTIATDRNNLSVAGIVSKNPAYLMNSDAGNNDTHPAIALKGRVPCKVVGKINKGDPLVTSQSPGHATAYNDQYDNAAGILGIALEDYPGGLPGIIEVKV